MLHSKEFRFSDPSIRLVAERDTGYVEALFTLNYGTTYPFPDVYDGTWVKRCVYGGDIVCAVLEGGSEVIASCAVLLDSGDYNDQIGQLARLVVHPSSTGKGVGRRIINGVLEAAESYVDFAVAEARTAHAHSQKMVEEAGFAVVGFVPQYRVALGKREGQVIYAKLSENGRALRDASPRVIPEIAPLAQHVLGVMGLAPTLNIIDACQAYPVERTWRMQRVDRTMLVPLARIEHGRLVDPLLFGGVSLDQGFSAMSRRNAEYFVALNAANQPVGAFGLQFDQGSGILKGIEMIGVEASLRGYLCESFVQTAEGLGASVIEVNVSAYDSRLQRTFYELGFRPSAYAPAMVFHRTSRLDVVKMTKLNEPSVDMQLTDAAAMVVSIVRTGFVT